MLEPYTYDYERNWEDYKKDKEFEDKYFWMAVLAIILIAIIL